MPRDEVGDPAVGLLPDLRAGGLVVRARVVRVGVLVGLPGARGLADQPVGDVVVGVGVLRGDGGRADDDLGAVRLEHVALVLADLVGADEDAVVAALPGRPWPARRRCCPRSARRSCRRASARREASAASIIRDGDPVLHRAAGVEVLDLGQHQRAARALGQVERCGAAAPAGCCRRGRAATPRTPCRINIAAARSSARIDEVQPAPTSPRCGLLRRARCLSRGRSGC